MEQAGKFVGRYYRYPDLTGSRQAEGGRRLRNSKPRASSGTPLVSIITVCKNSSITLIETINSVLNQDYENIEYVIIDGLSSDNTVNIIKEFDSKIEYYISEPDKGIYDAINKGIILSKGEYIIILNSDDWYERNTVSSLVSAIRHTDCDFVGALARYVDEEGNSFVLPSMTYNKSTLLRMPVRHETLLIPSHLYDNFGPYSDTYKIIADYEFCIRLFKGGMRYYEVPHPLLNFRTSGVSSTDLKKLHSEHANLLQSMFPFLDEGEVSRLSNHSAARPYDFIGAIEKHLDQHEFVLASRAMLDDYRKVWGGPWSLPQADCAANHISYIYPEVSVLISLKEASTSLESNIRSLLNHEFYDIEVICIDDGSSIDKQAIVSHLAQGDRRIRVVEVPRDRDDPGSARNAGVREARGRYLFFFDGQYELADNCLVNFYRTATDSHCDVVFGTFAHDKSHEAGSNGHSLTASGPATTNIMIDQFAQSLERLKCIWGTFCKRDLAETIFFPERLGVTSIMIFILRTFIGTTAVTIIEDRGGPGTAPTHGKDERLSLKDCLDELTCRRMIWGILSEIGHINLANHLLFNDWNPQMLDDLEIDLSDDERRYFYQTLFEAFQQMGRPGVPAYEKPKSQEILMSKFGKYASAPL